MSQSNVELMQTLRQYLDAENLGYEEPDPSHLVVELPGEKKLRTTVSVVIGDYSLSINAFVCRRPDENHADVYRWLLERNRKIFGVAYALDQLGDIYLTGRLPLESISPDALDHLLGSVLSAADGDFNTILELGFDSAIRAEWRWRLSRGEATHNLEQFKHLAPTEFPAPQE
jgi:hypothetical protein